MPDREWSARVVQDGAGDLHISTSLLHAPAPVRLAVIDALGMHLGCSHDHGAEEMVKGRPQRENRYQSLRFLTRKARDDWNRYGERLVELVVDLLRTGRLRRSDVRDLEALFKAHEAVVLMRFSGTHDVRHLRNAIDLGLITQSSVIMPDTDAAYRAGAGLSALEATAAAPGDQHANVKDFLEQVVRVPLRDEDRAAMDYARHKAGVYIRKAVASAHHDVEASIIRTRGLTPAEVKPIRQAVEETIAENETEQQLVQRLRDAVVGTTIGNNIERIAKVELQEAHAQGAYQTLKREAREIAGQDDPEVYKITSPWACRECKRIWGSNGSKRYRLSEVETWEAAGGNFGKKAKDWGPTIGVVHPRCTCGPLLFFDPKTIGPALQSAQAIIERLGGPVPPEPGR